MPKKHPPFRINPEHLHLAECYGTKEEPEILRHVHAYIDDEGRQTVEAYNTRALFTIQTRLLESPDTELFSTLDTLLKRPDINAIREKADGEVVSILTEEREEGAARYRETTVRFGSDQTVTTTHATIDPFPNLQAIRDREALRPCLVRTVNIVEFFRQVRKIAFAAKQMGGLDNMTLATPLDDPNAPVRMTVEEGRTTASSIIKPVGELVPRPAVRWAELAKVVADLMETANADGDLGMTPMELDLYAGKLRTLSKKVLSNVASGPEEAEAVQLTFDETADLVTAHLEAEAERKEREKEEKGEHDTPDMLPPDDGCTFDANNKECARPEDEDGEDYDERNGLGTVGGTQAQTDEDWQAEIKPKT